MIAADGAAQAPAPLPPGPRQMPGMGPMPGTPRDGQTEKVGTATLSGRVLAADTGKPLRRALVRASSAETPQGRSVSTDADGRWQLKNLPAGSYRVGVSKGGFVDIAYGQRRPFEAGKVLELAEAQTLDKLDVSLPRAGVVTGRVLDEFGEPLTGARVQPLRYRYVAGQRRLTPFAMGRHHRRHRTVPTPRTFAGRVFHFRADVEGLMFGQSDDRVGYGTTYFPAPPCRAKRSASVAVGQETAQINIQMATSRVATISGTAVSRPAGRSAAASSC